MLLFHTLFFQLLQPFSVAYSAYKVHSFLVIGFSLSSHCHSSVVLVFLLLFLIFILRETALFLVCVVLVGWRIVLFLFCFVFHSISVRVWSGQYFSPFGLNTERYGLSLRIKSKCGKMWTRITPNLDNFRAVFDHRAFLLFLDVLRFCRKRSRFG